MTYMSGQEVALVFARWRCNDELLWIAKHLRGSELTPSPAPLLDRNWTDSIFPLYRELQVSSYYRANQ